MTYRLTYSFDKEEVISEILTCESESILGAYEHAIQYLEKQYGPAKILTMIGLSILLLDFVGKKMVN
ncbi:hypothetical protein G3578_09220 [Brevibacillus sp. SYP-B805]|uniref:hypothetical protein n=1 Tax=Brevibacillus sp. SYP-B805 TaxID=1578199 RepID=UPI0013FA5F6F|nr:hypothetical protein [Brevibacillus sp. SYP-B805]NGQ95334.1 hypothetical protein [Brevibacillus sp. SYP-B805]